MGRGGMLERLELRLMVVQGGDEVFELMIYGWRWTNYDVMDGYMIMKRDLGWMSKPLAHEKFGRGLTRPTFATRGLEAIYFRIR